MKKMIQVRNLTNHTVVYRIDDLMIRRVFRPYETIKIDEEELQKLVYQPGGKSLLKNSLCVEDEDFLAEVGINVIDVPEYFWTKADIVDVLKNQPLDVLLDALDFAPSGIVTTLIDEAVKMEIPDMNKREAIQEATGININTRINFMRELSSNIPVVDKNKQRRVQATSSKQRRVQTQ